DLGSSLSSDELSKKFRLAQNLARTARTNEVQLTGRNAEQALSDWSLAINALKEFVESFDEAKIKKVIKQRRLRSLKERGIDILIGTVVGLVTGAIITFAFNYLNTSNTKPPVDEPKTKPPVVQEKSPTQ